MNCQRCTVVGHAQLAECPPPLRLMVRLPHLFIAVDGTLKLIQLCLHKLPLPGLLILCLCFCLD